ncbi:MAG: YceI family protein [Candidatus Sericytochromatia bacterium]|nr:YceI family protein [Candidatus Sericytochromatia bacterium]
MRLSIPTPALGTALLVLVACGTGLTPRSGAIAAPEPALPMMPPRGDAPQSGIGEAYVARPGSDSDLLVRVWRDGLAGALAHDHVIEATAFRGEVTIPRDGGDRAAVSFEVDARSLRPDRIELRRKVGLPGSLSEGDRATVLDHMQGADQLDVARHPWIRFRSSRVLPLGSGIWDVEGAFTLHGVTRPLRTRMTVGQEGGRLRARGNFRLLTSNYGIRPYEALGGLLKNKDQVDIQLDLVLESSRP